MPNRTYVLFKATNALDPGLLERTLTVGMYQRALDRFRESSGTVITYTPRPPEFIRVPRSTFAINWRVSY